MGEGPEDEARPDRPSLPPTQQRVVEAALRLSRARDAVALRYAVSEGDDHGRVVARGPDLLDHVMEASRGWRDLVATRTAGPLSSAGMVRALQNNQRILGDGTRMQSVFADHGFDDDLPDLLSGHSTHYRMGLVPFEMKILDQRTVMLEGPTVDHGRSVMLVSHPAVLSAALAYWSAVRRASDPAVAVAERGAGPLSVFSARQRAVVALLGRGVADDPAADLLGISVRTLRAEVAAVKDLLGVDTRFAAGVALGRLHAER
ncbi:hypothetical protein [uncultured Nocardioides sp.]|uniref:hypothetical protein n=1 Tax=uncultured Nocardioides sp. TaxID=198441 RepID=UPI002604D728|nr:hypothetical protein [uncultured Nocardioides sp.]